jgi:hypothetical protein
VTREGRFGAVLVSVALALGLFGYFVGHSGAPTDAEVAKAKSEAARSAGKSSQKRAYAAARRRGLSDGLSRGRAAGITKGRSEGKKRVKQAQAGQGTQTGTGTGTGSTTGGTGTQQGYSTAPLNGTSKTPPANSQQGQQLLKQSPDCKNAPPPPPDYHGPVQC